MRKLVSLLLGISLIMGLTGCVGMTDKMVEKFVEKSENGVVNIKNQSGKERFMEGIKMIDPSKEVDESIDLSVYGSSYNFKRLENIPDYATLSALLEKNKDKYKIEDYKYLEFFKYKDEVIDGYYSAARPKFKYELKECKKIGSINDLTPENLVALIQSDPKKYNLDYINITTPVSVDVNNFEIEKSVSISDRPYYKAWNTVNTVSVRFYGKTEDGKEKRMFPFYFYYDIDNKLQGVSINSIVTNESFDLLFTGLEMTKNDKGAGFVFYSVPGVVETYGYFSSEDMQEKERYVKNYSTYKDILEYHDMIYKEIPSFMCNLDDVLDYYAISMDNKDKYYSETSKEIEFTKESMKDSFNITVAKDNEKEGTEEKEETKGLILRSFESDYYLESSNTIKEKDNVKTLRNKGEIGVKIDYSYCSDSIDTLKEVVKKIEKRYNIKGLKIDNETENGVDYNTIDIKYDKLLKVEEYQDCNVSIYYESDKNMYTLHFKIESTIET